MRRPSPLNTEKTKMHRRSRAPVIETRPLTDSSDIESSKKKTSDCSTTTRTWRAALAFFVIAATVCHKAAYDNSQSLRRGSKAPDTEERSNGNEIRHDLASGVTLRLDLVRPDGPNDVVSMGPHNVSLSFLSGCDNPRVWIRFTGDALVSVPLKLRDQLEWGGTFSFPVEGTYRLDARWLGCDASGTWSSFLSPTDILVTGRSRNASLSRKFEPIFRQGAWLSSKKFKIEGSNPCLYIWYDPMLRPEAATLIKVSSSEGSSFVSKEGNLIPVEFRDLSNYELVCWVGSNSAASVHEAFLSARPALFRNQRPFKFHYYNVTSFRKPDQYWDESTKKRFRKCKTIIVSVDQLDSPMTHTEYKSQVKTFVGHLMKAITDETFPIWIVTVNEPPMAVSSMCSSPAAWSGNHPCNDALFALFAESTFPSRVKLMDTTDLVDPQFGENQKDIMAVIAMRVFTVVGNQVAEWRRAKQIGKYEGLVRDGNVLPNPQEVAYLWTA